MTYISAALRELVTNRPKNRCEYCLISEKDSLYTHEVDRIVPLFNPRTDNWDDHFRLEGAQINPLSAVGRVTEFTLKLNIETRLIERSALVKAERYP